MAEELRIMENKSREDTNLSPISKIEIYSFLILLAKIVLNYLQSYQN